MATQAPPKTTAQGTWVARPPRMAKDASGMVHISRDRDSTGIQWDGPMIVLTNRLSASASEKLAVMVTMDYLRREASAGRREDFEKYLDSVPTAPPMPGDELE